MNNNSTTNSTIYEEQLGKPYTGPTKTVWEDGRQIRKPDLDDQQRPVPPPNSSFVYTTVGKTPELRSTNV